MHLTLRFLGESSQAKAELLKKTLSEISEPSFSLTIQGTGVFPKKGNPKVAWAGIETSEALMCLQKKVEDACVKAGFKSEKRAFTPHITLGRVRKASAQDVKEWMEQYKDRQIAGLSVNQFILFVSRQKAGGVIHEGIKKCPLRADK